MRLFTGLCRQLRFNSPTSFLERETCTMIYMVSCSWSVIGKDRAVPEDGVGADSVIHKNVELPTMVLYE